MFLEWVIWAGSKEPLGLANSGSSSMWIIKDQWGSDSPHTNLADPCSGKVAANEGNRSNR